MNSSLENKFALTWRAIKGGRLIPEAGLIPGRRWRVDYLHPESAVVIEIEGGQWVGGRHGTGKGFEGDLEKYLAITLAGYTIFRLCGKQINVPTLERIAKFIQVKVS